MLDPEERNIYACNTCHDFKRVYAGKKDVECPECSGWTDDQRTTLRRSATRDRAEKPSIRAEDLTQDERNLVAQWRLDYPLVHELTLLTWIEGRRYDPAQDMVFLSEARKSFKKWQFLRNSHEGPAPEWARNALATGSTGGLSKTDVEYVESLRETK